MHSKKTTNMLVELDIDGRDVKLFLLQRDKKTDYVPLALALLNRLTTSQLATLIRCVGSKCFILYNELVEAFIFSGTGEREEAKCICGVLIQKQYFITNRESGESFIVGSTCKDNWERRDTEAYYCQFCCRRKTSREDCKNCQGKQNARSIADKWRANIREKIDYGQFRGQSYYRLVRTELAYCRWLVDKSKVSDQRRAKMRFYLDKFGKKPNQKGA